MCYLSSLTSQRAHVFYFVPRILYKTAPTSCKTPYAWSIIRSKREQGGYITMRHTTATHGGHVSKREAEQATVGLDIQRPKQHRTSKSERQPVLYGPELKIIHTACTRSTAAKVAQPKHISEMIPASKVAQPAQVAKAAPQSPAKSQPRMAPGATQTTPLRGAHQPATLHAATPQKTTAPHRATAPTARITKHHRPVAAQHAAPTTEAATCDDLTTLSSATNTLIAPCANPTPHCTAYVHPAWRATQYGFCIRTIRDRTTQCC